MFYPRQMTYILVFRSLSHSAPAFPMNEYEVFSVEGILDFRLNVTLGRFEFLVKWAGYSEEHNSWEPKESFLDDTSGLPQYIEQAFVGRLKCLRNYARYGTFTRAKFDEMLDLYPAIIEKCYSDPELQKPRKSSKRKQSTSASSTTSSSDSSSSSSSSSSSNSTREQASTKSAIKKRRVIDDSDEYVSPEVQPLLRTFDLATGNVLQTQDALLSTPPNAPATTTLAKSSIASADAVEAPKKSSMSVSTGTTTHPTIATAITTFIPTGTSNNTAVMGPSGATATVTATAGKLTKPLHAPEVSEIAGGARTVEVASLVQKTMAAKQQAALASAVEGVGTVVNESNKEDGDENVGLRQPPHITPPDPTRHLVVPCFTTAGFCWRYLVETEEELIADAQSFNELRHKYSRARKEK